MDNTSYVSNTSEAWNESSNQNLSKTDSMNDPNPNIPVVVTYIVICVCGVVGNGLVIFTITRYARLKTVTNVYICNLAFADFLFSLDLAPVAFTAWLQYWTFGDVICKLHFAVFTITAFESVLTLVLLSVERYVAVCHPFKSLGNKKTTRALIVTIVTWIVSFLFALPTILFSHTLPNWRKEGEKSCAVVWPDNGLITGNKAYIVYIFLLGFAVPMAIITVFYTLLVNGLRSDVLINQHLSAERRKKKRKVTVMVLAVITVYIVCWLPHWIFQLHLTFASPEVTTDMIRIYTIIIALSYVNSMLNPVLYAFLSTRFRNTFKQACFCYQ